MVESRKYLLVLDSYSSVYTKLKYDLRQFNDLLLALVSFSVKVMIPFKSLYSIKFKSLHVYKISMVIKASWSQALI